MDGKGTQGIAANGCGASGDMDCGGTARTGERTDGQEKLPAFLQAAYQPLPEAVEKRYTFAAQSGALTDYAMGTT